MTASTTRKTTTAATPTRQPRTQAGRTAAARTATMPPATVKNGTDDPDLLKGLTTMKPPARSSRAKAAPAPAAKPAARGKAAPAKSGKAAPFQPNLAKRELAQMIIVAAGDKIIAGSDAGMGKDKALTLVAQWLHYLPVGDRWPHGHVPVPARSDWNADGTRA